MYNITVIACTTFIFIFIIARKRLEKHSKLTSLRGPSRKNIIFGVTRYIRLSKNPKAIYEDWSKQYGSVYRIPLPFGSEAVVVSDLKAVAHIFAKDTFAYVKTPGLKVVIERIIGRGLLWVEGEVHRRQRRVMNPAFSPASIKKIAPSFYDTTYRLKVAWDKILDSTTPRNKAEIEMHDWMMKLTLDTVGCTIFGHEFNTLDGKISRVDEALRIFNTTTPSKLGMLIYAASIFVPWIGNLPTKRNQLFRNLSISARQILEALVMKQKEVEGDEKVQKREKSLLELLIDEETDGSGLQTTKEMDDIVTQMKAILIAASDPPGLMIVWALIELARHPEIQTRVRNEIITCPGAQLEWSQLQAACPFLDAVISEVLRLRLSIGETPRVANEDDVLYLNDPILDASGHLVDCIQIPKGTKIIVPNHFMNISQSIWGPDGSNFNPDRWMVDSISKESDLPLDVDPERRRLWSFGEGPRVCIGKAFAMTQIKIVLAVLLRHFIFELPQGPDTPLDIHYSLIPRPKIQGLEGAMMPLSVSRVGEC